jgi:hypothetical protein
MRKKKKVSHVHKVMRLVRSDNTLMILGIFSVAILLVSLYMYSNTSAKGVPIKTNEVERTYRVETAPAVIPQSSESSEMNEEHDPDLYDATELPDDQSDL